MGSDRRDGRLDGRRGSVAVRDGINPVSALTCDHDDRAFVAPFASTGLNYLNARYMDPALGVFISVDPLVAQTRSA